MPAFKAQKGANWKKNAKYVRWARRQNKEQWRETVEDNDRCRNHAVRWKDCTCHFKNLDKVNETTEILDYLSKDSEGENWVSYALV